jgi:predicted  nucleic acid-binding Zn-ribbon protein
MTDAPENVDLQWIGRTLITIQRDMRDIRADLQVTREDQRSMRAQVDVVVMTLLRVERNMTALGDEMRELRNRINRLEDAKP